MGGAQPLAITMNEGVALIAEVEPSRIDKRITSKYLDVKITDIDEAIDKHRSTRKRKQSVLVCNARRSFCSSGCLSATCSRYTHRPDVGHDPPFTGRMK
jgi:hypothetical protein